MIRVEICDDGPGIPEDIVDRIFTPFFTTKPFGEGTGLGLDLAWRIVVEKHARQHLGPEQTGRHPLHRVPAAASRHRPSRRLPASCRLLRRNDSNQRARIGIGPPHSGG